MKREIMKREIMKKKLSDLQCEIGKIKDDVDDYTSCLLYTSPSPRDIS